MDYATLKNDTFRLVHYRTLLVRRIKVKKCDSGDEITLTLHTRMKTTFDVAYRLHM